VLSLATPGVRAAQNSYVYTATHGPSCTDRSREGFGRWRCPGPDGYVAEYVDEGNVAGIAIWRPTRQQRSAVSVSWRGAGRVFGDKIEWRMAAGRPIAAILRVWRTASMADGREHKVEELLILKVLAAGACRVASIDAHRPNANEIARRTSDEVATLPCRTDP
jgi:hypothetical protein